MDTLEGDEAHDFNVAGVIRDRFFKLLRRQAHIHTGFSAEALLDLVARNFLALFRIHHVLLDSQ